MNHRATWERARQRPCRAGRMTYPEYLVERAQAVLEAALHQEARGWVVPRDSVTEMEQLVAELARLNRQVVGV